MKRHKSLGCEYLTCHLVTEIGPAEADSVPDARGLATF